MGRKKDGRRAGPDGGLQAPIGSGGSISLGLARAQVFGVPTPINCFKFEETSGGVRLLLGNWIGRELAQNQIYALEIAAETVIRTCNSFSESFMDTVEVFRHGEEGARELERYLAVLPNSTLSVGALPTNLISATISPIGASMRCSWADPSDVKSGDPYGDSSTRGNRVVQSIPVRAFCMDPATMSLLVRGFEAAMDGVVARIDSDFPWITQIFGLHSGEADMSSAADADLTTRSVEPHATGGEG